MATPIPSTVSEAVNLLYATLDDRAQQLLTEHPTECQHLAASTLRNDWDLWNENSPLRRDAALQHGLAHADDVSAFILSQVKARAQA